MEIMMKKTFLNDSLEGATKEIIADTLYVYGQYSHNKEVGKWTWKIKDKTVFKTQVYSDGNETGEIIFYHPNGKPFHVGQLINVNFREIERLSMSKENLSKMSKIKNDTFAINS